MRVGIAALLQESNTFTPGQTTLADFEADLLLEGEDIRDQLAEAPHEIGGFFAGLAEAGLEAVPTFAARAIPWGPISAATFNILLERLIEQIAVAGPLDGILVAAHGATVSEEIPDVDGHWLAELRKRVGTDVPIVGTLDLHANLSPSMVESCDALIAYRTNPHLDQRDRGLEAARLMSRVLRDQTRPCQAAAYLPLSISLECQHSGESPCLELFQQLEELLLLPDVLGASALLGFPYADVSEMGAAVLVVSSDLQSAAELKANNLASWIWERRDQFVRQPISMADALARVARSAGPTCLLDVGDNIGGGGPGDSTHLAQALWQREIGPALVCLFDPQTVERARRFAVGEEFEATIGGKSCALVGPPLRGKWRIQGHFDGKFTENQPRHGGFKKFDQGPTVVLEAGDRLTVIVTSRRMPPYSLAQITHCGVVPENFRVLIAKGVHAPVAAYREVCHELLRVDTPGVTTADV
ncbi:MAG: M81 family metallopeptidase, partial [Pirellulales bacterium]